MILQKGFQPNQLPQLLTISQDRKKTFREISTCALGHEYATHKNFGHNLCLQDTLKISGIFATYLAI